MTSTRKDHFSGHIVVCSGTSINISEMKSFIVQLKNAQNSHKHDFVSFLDENDPSASEWQTFCRQQGVFLKKVFRKIFVERFECMNHDMQSWFFWTFEQFITIKIKLEFILSVKLNRYLMILCKHDQNF